MKNKNLKPLSIDDFARLLAVSPRTVRRMIDRGDLPTTRIGATLTLSPVSLPEPLCGEFQRGSASPLLSLHEVADRLGCSPNRVRELTAEGSLHPIRVGGSRRWSLSDIEAYRNGGRRDGSV